MEKDRKRLNSREILGKKALILGEAGSGKTRLAIRIVKDLMEYVDSEEITIIDFAPERIEEIGGRLSEHMKLPGGAIHLAPEVVYTPRLSGSSPAEILHYAELNAKNMKPLLDSFIQNATEVLVINDVTLYFHSGKFETVLRCVKLSETFLGTAYYGVKLTEDLGAGVSLIERKLTEQLMENMDLVFKTQLRSIY